MGAPEGVEPIQGGEGVSAGGVEIEKALQGLIGQGVRVMVMGPEIKGGEARIALSILAPRKGPGGRSVAQLDLDPGKRVPEPLSRTLEDRLIELHQQGGIKASGLDLGTVYAIVEGNIFAIIAEQPVLAEEADKEEEGLEEGHTVSPYVPKKLQLGVTAQNKVLTLIFIGNVEQKLENDLVEALNQHLQSKGGEKPSRLKEIVREAEKKDLRRGEILREALRNALINRAVVGEEVRLDRLDFRLRLREAFEDYREFRRELREAFLDLLEDRVEQREAKLDRLALRRQFDEVFVEEVFRDLCTSVLSSAPA